MARLFTTSDILDHDVGALSGMTYGTTAVIFKTSTLTGSRTYFGLHTSGGVGRLQLNVDVQTVGYWNGGNYRQSGNVITSTSTWYLLVVRKATGSQIARASVYDFGADTWTHTAISTAISDSTSPGVGGFVEFRYEAAEQWQGDIAIRAAWSNLLPWTADSAGDLAIEAQGLHLSLMAWYAASPSALWLYDQQATSQTVPDLAGGAAGQSSITGTAVSTTSVPTFSYGNDLFEVLSAPSAAAVAEKGVAAAASTGQATQVKVAKQGAVCSAATTSTATRTTARAQSGICAVAATAQATGRKVVALAGTTAAASSAAATAAKKTAAAGSTAAAATIQARAAKKTAAAGVTTAGATISSTARKVIVGVGQSYAAAFTYRTVVIAPRAVSGACFTVSLTTSRAVKVAPATGATAVTAMARGNGLKRATPAGTCSAAGHCQATPRKKAPVTGVCPATSTATVALRKTATARGYSSAAGFCEGRRRALSRWTYRPNAGTTARPVGAPTTTARPNTGTTPRPVILT